MAYDFKNIAQAGLNRSKRKLKSLEDLPRQLSMDKKKKQNLDDLGYYLMLKSENRKMFKDKYSEIAENPFIKNNFKDMPSFDEVYRGKKKFTRSGLEYSLSDLSNLIQLNKMQTGELKFDINFGENEISDRPDDAPKDVPDWMFEPIVEPLNEGEE